MRSRAAWIPALGGLLLVLSVRASFAVRPEARDFADARRFGLGNWSSVLPSDPGKTSLGRQAIDRFNASFRPSAYATRSSGSGAPAADASQATQSFLQENKGMLGVDPRDLKLELSRDFGGIRHLLFSQFHQGIPVEFSRLKVHLNARGEILSFQSSCRPNISASPIPAVAGPAAAQAVSADMGGAAPDGGSLAFLPLPSGEVRLAWKFRLSGGGGGWVYYVDANSGALLLRYNDLRRATSGVVTGEVFDIDPSSTPAPTARPLADENIYIQGPSTVTVTAVDGSYSNNNVGKIFSFLQGPNVYVSHSNGWNAHYDNGGGAWTTFSSPISSPHPYPNSSVIYSTVNLVSPPLGEVAILPHFSSFNVGSISSQGDILDDDQVSLLDQNGNAVATYIGSKGAFIGAAIPGAQARLRLKSNSSGQNFGFDVDISSYLVLNSPQVAAGVNTSFLWKTTDTYDGTRDEINLFYHLNLMHDYFINGVDSSSAAYISVPLAAMAHAGSNMANSYYDPVGKHLAFGDGGNDFALDATVIHHEYVHFVVDQIYPVINFGQSGALSEAVADYFSASSLNDSSIGKYTGATLGEGSVRELNCPTKAACALFPADWIGEIHQDSRMVSQALWEIRSSAIGTLGTIPGQTCADGLAFQALLFFPDSFQDFLQAMLTVSDKSATLAPSCGANSSQDALIAQRFSVHGITLNPADQDPYEPNNGPQTATDITTIPVISARIYPAADQDWYTFAAAPGKVHAVLGLPSAGSGQYFAYGLTLLDKNYQVIATANPPININPTSSGNCPNANCMTTASQVTLDFQNSSASQFFLEVAALPGDNGSNSATYSPNFYSLTASYGQVGSLGANIVTASFDKDVIHFSVLVSSFLRTQNYSWDYAQLRDQSLAVLPQTATNGPGTFLTSIATANAFGMITGQVSLQPGFAARFPALGTVHLEVFAKNLSGDVASLGFSPAINLTASQAQLTAFNNVFNPNRGEKATFKYEILQPGNVTMRLYTMSGAEVLTLLDGFEPAGKGSIDWDGGNSAGRKVASGIYLLHMKGPGIEKTQKVIVVK